MIDFTNGSLVKLSTVNSEETDPRVSAILLEGEKILLVTKGIRDSVIFTDRRIVISNVQGMTGKKTALTTLPYSKLVAFSVENGGTFDLDAEVTVWLSGVGHVTFEFTRGTDVGYISRILASVTL